MHAGLFDPHKREHSSVPRFSCLDEGIVFACMHVHAGNSGVCCMHVRTGNNGVCLYARGLTWMNECEHEWMNISLHAYMHVRGQACEQPAAWFLGS